jgi:hypothetical protein
MPPKSNSSKATLNDDIRRVLLLDGYRKTYLASHIRGLIRTYGLAGIKSDGATGLMFDILFIDNVTTHHFGQFQKLWPEHRASDGPDSDDPEHQEWWKVFRGFLRDCFNKTRVHMNRYFRESHPTAPAKKNWFPRPPKMTPPKPDLGTPPIVIKSVNVPKRKFQATDTGSSRSAGKRLSKRVRMRSLATPEDSPVFSSVSEEDDATSSGEETPTPAPAVRTPKSTSTHRLKAPKNLSRESSRTLPREQGTIANPAFKKPMEPEAGETESRSCAASPALPPAMGLQSKGTTVVASASTSEGFTTVSLPGASPAPPVLGIQSKGTAVVASATTPGGFPTASLPTATTSSTRYSRLGRNGLMFKQRLPGKPA